MSDDEEVPKSSNTLGIAGLLTSNPLTKDPNEPEQPEPKSNEILTNIIKDSSKVANQEDRDFNNEDIQQKMTGLISDLQSESIIPDDQHVLPRKSITSGHLIDNQENNSTPAIIDSSSENPPQPPVRSMSESILVDHPNTNESSVTLPIQQDENSTDEDDDSRTPTNNTKEVANIARQPSPSKSITNKNQQTNELPTAIISPASRRESNQQQASQSSKLNENSFETSNNDFIPTNEQSRLIKSGEQLRIPTNDINNERINSPPPSPSTTKQMVLTNPLLENNRQNNSRPSSQISRKSPTTLVSNEKVIDGDAVSSKSRPSSKRSTKGSNVSDEKASNKKANSRRSSTNSTKTADQTVVTPIRVNSNKSEKKRSSVTDSEAEKLPRIHSSSRTTTPTGDQQTNQWAKQVPIPAIQTTDDDIRSSRPQSPNVEQIAERNPTSNSNKKRNKKEQKQSLRRSNSAESFNHIPLVDDKSLDSTSGNNTETDNNPKQRRIKSKKKDVETNTDSKNSSLIESTSQKPLKSTPDHSSSTRRRLPTKEVNLTTPDTEPEQKIRRSVKKTNDSNENKDPVNVNVTVLVKNLNNEDDDNNKNTSKNKQKSLVDPERHTQSDSEQIVTEKQKKRRRPKRISRTTQTYESVFRRMEREEHEELRPTNDLDKNMQTKKSRLRPRTKSPKRHYPIYLSTDAFKVEEILPKQFPNTQRNQSKTSMIAQSNSPQNGKLLILRPTLPFHHTDAVNVQRISLQYAIDLIPNKSTTPKQIEQTNNLPMIRSSSNTPTNKLNTKDKTNSNKNEDRTHQRKDDWTV